MPSDRSSFHFADGDEGGDAFVPARHEAREQGEESESKVYSMWVVIIGGIIALCTSAAAVFYLSSQEESR
jgi:hypothetical protein